MAQQEGVTDEHNGVTIKRIARALTSVIEVTGRNQPDAVRLSAETIPSIGAGVPKVKGFQLSEASHETYFLLRCNRLRVNFEEKTRAITVQEAEHCELHVGDCITSLSLIRCKKCVIRIVGSVGSIKIDDCTSIDIHLSWEAALGYRDDGSTREAYLGLPFFHSASHAISVHTPVSRLSADTVSRSLPEMVRTLLPGPTSPLESHVIDPRSPWGQHKGLTAADVQAARQPQ